MKRGNYYVPMAKAELVIGFSFCVPVRQFYFCLKSWISLTKQMRDAVSHPEVLSILTFGPAPLTTVEPRTLGVSGVDTDISNYAKVSG